MDHNNPEGPRDPGGESGLTAGCQVSDPFCPEKEQKRCMVTDDVTTHGSWSQSSISRSLQRAEVLLRSTFNPSLKWLFHGPGPDEDSDEGNFVAAHNLVSRSSARLLRLQQALFTVAPQWQLVGGAQAGAAQVCVKGLSAEGAVLLPPCSSFLQEHYRSLKRLLEQRSLLLFSHEYIRRTRLTAAYISRLSHLLETSHITLNQTPSNWVSYSVGLSSLSHELRVHLNHWSCLFSKVQSDQYLRPAMAQQTRLLAEMKQTLSSLGLQAMVLMEKYVYVILSAVAQTPLDHVPTDVLEDILAGTDLYNQVMEEQKHRATQLRTAVLHQANHSTLGCGLPVRKEHHPAAFSVKELTMILSVHHARLAANELQCWASIHSHHICPIHSNHEVHASSVNSRISCTQRPEWTWEQLQQTYLTTPLLTDNHHHKLHSPSHHSSGCIPHHHPVSVRPPSVQHRTHTSNKDQTNRCQRNTSQTGGSETSVEALDSDIGGYSRTTPPTGSFHHLLTQQDRPSVELLYQLLVSSRDLMAPLVSHLSTTETEQLLPNTATDVISPRRRMNALCSPALVINAVDSAQERLCSETKKEQNKGNQPVWAELQITTRPEATSSSGFQRTVDPEKEKTTGEPDYGCWPHSVQWLDLGQSLVFADLLRQYRTRLWTLCCRTLWLQMCVPHTGNTVVCINLQDNYWAFQLLHWARQVSNTDHVPTECRAMLEDFSLTLLDMTAHAQWDNVLCIGLGSALKDKCLADVSPGGSVMSATMKHFLLLTPPLLSSLNHHQSNSSTVGSLQRHIVSLVLATVQLCTVWIMSKSYQFLSSWSLNKFLLITHGDLRVFRNSLGTMMHLTKSLVMNSDSDNCSALYSHCQSLMRQQLGRLDRAVSELQTFSSLVLKTFSTDCKRMSGQIFEQAMPPSVHWRPSHRTGFPNSPNEYASVAAQTVIGQVLEGVAPLSDDARIQALSITMTAFLEAWMEHILRQKIKFSLQGALQLKQDFDSIKDLIQSDRYGLSADLLQQLLGLRVFQQVDSAVMCLLQQPQAKPYLQSRSWVPFTRCCPTNNRSSTDAPSRSSITNLRCVEGEDPADPSVVMSDLPPVDSSAPGEPYLAPSVALGAAQQDWLDLRIHSSARRWKLPGLQCLSKSEP